MLTSTDMQNAFERVLGARFSDIAWRAEMTVWGKCWHECSRLFGERLSTLEQQLEAERARAQSLERQLARATGGMRC